MFNSIRRLSLGFINCYLSLEKFCIVLIFFKCIIVQCQRFFISGCNNVWVTGILTIALHLPIASNTIPSSFNTRRLLGNCLFKVERYCCKVRMAYAQHWIFSTNFCLFKFSAVQSSYQHLLINCPNYTVYFTRPVCTHTSTYFRLPTFCHVLRAVPSLNGVRQNFVSFSPLSTS